MPGPGLLSERDWPTFITYDLRQVEAAQTVGLTLVRP
jgi:hypothetical protein